MNNPLQSSLLQLILFAGFTTMICAGVMMSHQSNEMTGAKEKDVAILALEFTPNSSKASEILNLWSEGFQDQVEHEKYISNLQSQIYLDFPFLFAYSSFFAFLALYFFRRTGRSLFMAGILLAVFMLLGDVLENWQMLEIIDRFDISIKGFGEADSYPALRFFTLLKWGSICLSFFLFAGYFLKVRSWKNWLMGLVCLGPFFTGLLLFFAVQLQHDIVEPGSNTLVFATVNFLAIVVGLLGLFVYTLMQYWQLNRT